MYVPSPIERAANWSAKINSRTTVMPAGKSNEASLIYEIYISMLIVLQVTYFTDSTCGKNHIFTILVGTSES